MAMTGWRHGGTRGAAACALTLAYFSPAEAAQKRLAALQGNEEAIRVSLGNRRAIVGEVLASLQRMGRRPPPALLVRPEDMLSAIRTSMLLGAVLPEMRAETEALAADLAQLVTLRTAISGERDTLSRELAGMREERQRLSMLVEARQQALSAAQRDLEAQHDRSNELSRKAASLRDLIASVESDAVNQRAPDEAAKAATARKQADAVKNDGRTRLAGLPGSPFSDVARLAPAIAFGEARGLLPLPVNGSLIKAFGAPDGFGSTEKGLSVTTRVQAIVSAPCDGWIAYSGPYRTYGQLLIINAGSGYYVVLAGMERINVDVGQFVLTGEPVATMGDGTAKTAAAIAIGAAQPVLYVEFRKDGTPIDPGPWWARPEMKKVRGRCARFLSLYLAPWLGPRLSRSASRPIFSLAAPPEPRSRTRIGVSISSATCSRRSAQTMSRSRTSRS